jgi:hypothetical protein
MKFVKRDKIINNIILGNDIYLCSVELTKEEASLLLGKEYEYDLEVDVYITMHEEFLFIVKRTYRLLVEHIAFEYFPEIKQKYKVYKLLK